MDIVLLIILIFSLALPIIYLSDNKITKTTILEIITTIIISAIALKILFSGSGEIWRKK